MAHIPAEKGSLVLLAEPLRPGGVTTYAASLLSALPEAGFYPRLAAPDGPRPGNFEPRAAAAVTVFPGAMSTFRRPFVLPRLLSWAREGSPTLIHGLSGFTAPLCQRLAEALNLPYILSVHHFQTGHGLRIDARCRRVIACSEVIRENLVNAARVPKELVKVVPIGICVPELSAEPEVSAAEAPQMPLVATFAKLTPRKDLATFLRAARQVLDVLGERCQFLIVGDGPEESSLRKLSRSLRLEKHVTFSPASVPHGPILKDVAVYVQTSREEGFGAAVLEAMAWNTPVVATSVGGIIALVRDGQTGYLVPVGDPGPLAGKILDLLNDPALRARLGQAGRARVAEKYTLQKMIEGTVEVYTGVLATNPLPSSPPATHAA